MVITLKLEAPTELTEAICLLASAIAYKNGMDNTQASLDDILHEVVEKPAAVHAPEEVDPPKKEETVYGLQDIRALMVEKNSPSNRAQLKDILNRYGADRISDLDEKHFDAVAKDLEAI